MARVLVIADLQTPFEHKKYLSFLKETYKKYRCNEVVCIGDEIDHHALGDYEHDPDGYSAGHELEKAIKHLLLYYKAFPKMLLCESNHTGRILKKAFKNGIPLAYMRDFKEVIGAPSNWKWREKWEIDGVVYKHGMGYSGPLGALNAAKDELRSCVIGHLHADAGILYWSNGSTTLFGMNVGSGIDPTAYAFKYAKYSRKKAVLSCGVVLDGAPYLIPMKVK
jgi:hypothetical protein